MMIETAWLPAAVLVPLLLGALSFVLPRAARGLALAGALLMAGLVLPAVSVATGPIAYELGGWPPPLGIALVADGISFAFLALTVLVFGGVMLYALAWFEPDGHTGRHFWPLAWLLWAALNASFVASDLFNLFVSLELLSLTAVALAALEAQRAALAAALRYLLAVLAASNLFLLAVALLYGATGVLSLDQMGARLEPGHTASLALALLVVALALKTALLPLHFWLPPAHGSAAPPVSALLSALVIKASLVALLRVWMALAPEAQAGAASLLLAALGAAAILWGSIAALQQQRLKLVIAYSTVAQIGYLFVAFGWLLGVSPVGRLALEGLVLQGVAHGLAKSAMFLAAGGLVLAAGRDDLAGLRGAAARQPRLVFALGLAGASLVGLPPTLGFAGKWQLLGAALAAGHWVLFGVLLAGSLLAAAYVFRVLRLTFMPLPEDAPPQPPQPAALDLVPLLLALAAALGGLGSAALLDRLDLTGLLP
jgi:multicomponent Na+:H+ antiporter subunit D